MKWLYLTAGGIALVLAIVSLIGALLPRAHRASRQARYRQKPEAIYFALAGPLDWRRDVNSSGTLPDRDGRKQWWEQDIHGHRIAYELLDDRMPSRRVTRIADPNLPFGGTWTFDIAPVPEGSLVRITEVGEIYNVIFRFLARFFFGYTASIEGYLRDLGHRFGELIVIES
jgi:hypothetical protein